MLQHGDPITKNLRPYYRAETEDCKVDFNVEQVLREFPARGMWHLALTRTSWNGRPATLDLRRWSEDYTRMSKGLTLTPEEYELLKGGF